MANSSGAAGEQAVADLLVQSGYTLLARNYHSRWGEIDIIVRDAKYIVFVEVKTRDQARKTEPEEAVTRSKQKKILSTALAYLQEYPQWQELQPRFDVAAVTASGLTVKSIRYLSGVWFPDGEEGGFF